MKKILGITLVALAIILYLLLYALCVTLEFDKMYLLIHGIGYLIIIICPIGLYLFHKNKN